MKYQTLLVAAFSCFNCNAHAFVSTAPTLRMRKMHLGSSTEPVPAGFVADSDKRSLMNSILLTSLVGSCGPLVAGFGSFFMPVIDSNSGAGIVAKDKDGNDVLETQWLGDHKHPSRALVQGLKGDAHYLITREAGGLERYALNAVCTHLGCVVPWNPTENKFMCPCHGSQYNNEGKVIRGPAPRSLAMAGVENIDGKVYLKQWDGEDFRTNEPAWWL